MNALLRRRALDAANQVVHSTAVFDLVRRDKAALAGELVRLHMIGTERAAQKAAVRLRLVAQASRSSVVIAALFSAFYAGDAHDDHQAQSAIHAAEIAAERSHRLSN